MSKMKTIFSGRLLAAFMWASWFVYSWLLILNVVENDLLHFGMWSVMLIISGIVSIMNSDTVKQD
jgi:hypothetical protein